MTLFTNKEFEDFWNLYDKKVGKVNALKEWKKLKPLEIERVFEHVPFYLKTREKQFRKDPERYLKHKIFMDEITAIKTIEPDMYKPFDMKAIKGIFPDAEEITNAFSFKEEFKIKEEKPMSRVDFVRKFGAARIGEYKEYLDKFKKT